MDIDVELNLLKDIVSKVEYGEINANEIVEQLNNVVSDIEYELREEVADESL